MSDDIMLRIALEALRRERDDLVKGIDLVQRTAVKWAVANGGDTPLALIAQQLRDLIPGRATKPGPAEAQPEPTQPTPAEGTQQPEPSPGTSACETDRWRYEVRMGGERWHRIARGTENSDGTLSVGSPPTVFRATDWRDTRPSGTTTGTPPERHGDR